jgi:hypothetical protein
MTAAPSKTRQLLWSGRAGVEPGRELGAPDAALRTTAA